MTLRLMAGLGAILCLTACAYLGSMVGADTTIDDVRVSVAAGEELPDHDALAERLDIPRSRLSAITVGAGSKAKLTGLLSGARLDYICTEASCTCTGDSDCNDMYETVCSDPKTNGVCIETGTTVTCSCTF